MASSRFLHLFLFFLLAGLASSTTILSNDIFEPPMLPGRALLQQKAACSIDFENANYTIITSQCKGPNYQAKPCCGALKELSCPYRKELNDMKNDCATTLFSYINLYGKYPPGLFSNLCKENNGVGLDCTELLPSAKSSASKSMQSPKMMMILTLCFLKLLFHFF